MNKLTIIGALGNDPELKSTKSGIPVCTFSVAVNGKKGDEKTTTWFRVTAWRQLGELCSKYLTKGRKVAVVGSVQVSTYTGSDGSTRASLEVTADEVEFLSAANQGEYQERGQETRDQQNGFVRVDDEELPF